MGNPLDAVFGLEYRLGGSELIGFAVRLTSSVRLPAHLEGTIELRPSGEAMAELHGELSSVETRLVSSEDGRQLIVEAEGREVVMDAPEGFREIIAAGLVRVGLLDVMLRVLSGTPPTDAEALRRDADLKHIAEMDPEMSWPDLYDCTGHAFSVHNARGFEIAQATLWIDRVTGLPRERTQSVDLIRVASTEQYWDFFD